MIARFYNSCMPKAAPEILTTANLERIYAEIEARVERKFEDRIRRLEAELERTKRDRDLWRKRYFREKETNERLQHQLEMAKAENKILLAKIEKLEARIAELEKERYGRKNEASKESSPQVTHLNQRNHAVARWVLRGMVAGVEPVCHP